MSDINPFTGKPYKKSTKDKNELEQFTQDIIKGTLSGNWGTQNSQSTPTSNPFITSEPDPYTDMDLGKFTEMIVNDVRRQDPIKPTQENRFKSAGPEPIINMNNNGIRKSILDRPPLVPTKKEPSETTLHATTKERRNLVPGENYFPDMPQDPQDTYFPDMPTYDGKLKKNEKYEDYKAKVQKGREGAPLDLQDNPITKIIQDNILDPIGFAAEQLHETPLGRVAISAGEGLHGQGSMLDMEGNPLEKNDHGFITNFLSDAVGNMASLKYLTNNDGMSLLGVTDKIGERAGKAIYDKLPQGANATKNIINTIISDMGRGAVDNAVGNAVIGLGQGQDLEELLESTGMGALYGGTLGGLFSGLRNAPELMRNRMTPPDINVAPRGSKLLTDGDVTSASTSHTPVTPEPGPMLPDNQPIKDVDVDIKGTVNPEAQVPNNRVVQRNGSYIDITENPLANGDLEVNYTEHRPVIRTRRGPKANTQPQEPLNDVGQANTPVEDKKPMVDEYGPSIKGFTVEDTMSYANDVKSGKVDPVVKLNDFGNKEIDTQYILNNGNRADLMEIFNEHAQGYFTLKEQGGDKNIMAANKMRAKEVLQAMEMRGMELPKDIPTDFQGELLTRLSSKEDMNNSVANFLENKIKDLDNNPGVKATQMDAYNAYQKQLNEIKGVKPEATQEVETAPVPEKVEEPKYTTKTYEIPKPDINHHGMVDRSTKAEKPSILEPPPLKPEAKMETKAETKPEAKEFKEPEQVIRSEVMDALRNTDEGIEVGQKYTLDKYGEVEVLENDRGKIKLKNSKGNELTVGQAAFNKLRTQAAPKEDKASTDNPKVKAFKTSTGGNASHAMFYDGKDQYWVNYEYVNGKTELVSYIKNGKLTDSKDIPSSVLDKIPEITEKAHKAATEKFEVEAKAPLTPPPIGKKEEDKSKTQEEYAKEITDYFDKAGRKGTSRRVKAIMEAINDGELSEDYLTKVMEDANGNIRDVSINNPASKATKKDKEFIDGLPKRMERADSLYRNLANAGHFEMDKNATLKEKEAKIAEALEKQHAETEAKKETEKADKEKKYKELYDKTYKEYEWKIKADIENGLELGEIVEKYDTDEELEGLDVSGSHFALKIGHELLGKDGSKEYQEEQSKESSKFLLENNYNTAMRHIDQAKELIEETRERIFSGKKLLKDQRTGVDSLETKINTLNKYINDGEVEYSGKTKEIPKDKIKEMKSAVNDMKSILVSGDLKPGDMVHTRIWGTNTTELFKIKNIKDNGEIVFDLKTGMKDQEDMVDYYWGQSGLKAPKLGDGKIISIATQEDIEQGKIDSLNGDIQALQAKADGLFKRHKTEEGKAVKEEIKKKQKELDKLKKKQGQETKPKVTNPPPIKKETKEVEPKIDTKGLKTNTIVYLYDERIIIDRIYKGDFGNTVDYTIPGKKGFINIISLEGLLEIVKRDSKGNIIVEEVDPKVTEAPPIKAEAKPEPKKEEKKDLTPPPIKEEKPKDTFRTKDLQVGDYVISVNSGDNKVWKVDKIDKEKKITFLNGVDKGSWAARWNGQLNNEKLAWKKVDNPSAKEEISKPEENILEQKGGVDNEKGNDNVGRESGEPTQERYEPVQLSESDRETSSSSEGNEPESGPNARIPVSSNEGEPAAGRGPSSDERDSKGVPNPMYDTGDSGKRAPRSSPRKRDNNFVIDNKTVIFEPGNKTKLKNNIDAIKTMMEIEKSGKAATKAQKETLVKYVGWGGLSDVFNTRYQRGGYVYVGDYEKEYNEIKELLTKEEFEAARSSSTTAFYTPMEVIGGMYDLLDHLGFKGGRILDPSTGTGHFQGLLPKKMRENSKFLAIEKDSISGRISRLLYPDSDIRISGFEEVDLPNNYFDLAISNVPFGNFGVNDSDYGSYVTERIHDYFFIKALDKVKPGGAVAFITATSTMDNSKSEIRKLINSMADLVTAVRVDNTTFSKNAGTTTAADILIFRKRIPGEVGPLNTKFVESQKTELEFGTYFINEYFKENPKNVLGKYAKANWSSLTVEPDKNSTTTFPVWVKGTKAKLPKDLISPIKGEIVELTPEEQVKQLKELKEGSYFVDGGVVYQKKGKAKLKVEGNKVKKIKALVEIKDAVKEVITLQRQEKPDSEVKKAQEKLNKVYDKFVNQYGAISETKNSNVLKDDPENYILQSLEPEYDKKTKTAKKAHIFSKIELRPRKQVETASNVEEALSYSFNEKGGIDLDWIAKLVSSDKATVTKDLTKSNLIFEDPTSGWQSREMYLSGDVREKLVEAKKAAELDKSFERNVKELEKVLPEDIPFNEIDIKLGASWIPKKVYEQFMKETFRSGYNTPDVSYNSQTGTWIISKKGIGNIQTFEFKEKFGTKGVYASVILENTMNMKKTVVTYKDPEGKAILDKDQTLLAQEKSELLKEEFQTWLYKDGDRVKDLARIYNDKFNSIVEPVYSGRSREFPGMNDKYTLRTHQIAVADRVIQSGNTLIAHGVGTGKTLVQIATAMEWRRLGICKKPIWVVPKNRLGQSQADFLDAYPNAKILVASEVDFSPKEIKALFARITTGDWDCVIIPHSSLTRIPVSRETEQAFMQAEMQELEDAILSAREDGEKNIVKDLVKTLETMRTNLEALLDAKRFDVSTIEEMGIDGIIVDESHEFRNVGTYTKFTRIKGIKTTPVKKAKDLMMKVRYISGLHGGNAGVVFATGTPIVNSLNEVYNTFKYLRPDILKSRDINSFDSFMSTFGAIENEVEVTADGRWKPMDRFRKFTNAAELMSLFKIFTDIKLDATELNLGLPDLKGGAPEMVKLEPHPEFDVFVDELIRRSEALEHRKGKPEKGEDNHLSVFNDSKKATTDLRLIDNTLPDHEGSKINVCVNNVYDIYKESTDRKATQLIFLDRGRSMKDGAILWDAYADLKAKLIEKGVPENEIAFPVTYTTKEKKQSLFDEVNKGNVRILIGSYDAMGTGLNVQERLYAIHELDTPYNPATIEQAEGRMVRQKNKHYEWKIPVKILRYAVSGTGSYDTMGWQILESKVKGQKKFYKGELRNFDIDSEDDDLKNIQMIKAISTGDERVVRKIKVDQEVSRLKSLKRNFLFTLSNNQAEIDRTQRTISFQERKILNVTRDLNAVKGTEPFTMSVNGKTYADKEEAGNALKEALRGYQFRNNIVDSTTIGTYRGLTIAVVPSPAKVARYVLKGNYEFDFSNPVDLTTGAGVIQRLNRTIDNMAEIKKNSEEYLKTSKENLEKYKKASTETSFKYEDELNSLLKEQVDLNTALGQTKKDDIVEVENFTEEPEDEPKGKPEDETAADLTIDLKLHSGDDFESVNERLKDIIFKGYEPHTITKIIKKAPMAPPPIPGKKQKVSKFKTNTWRNAEMFGEPEMQALIDDLDAFYQYKPTVETFSRALDMLEDDFEGTMSSVLSGKEELTAEDVTASAIITANLMEQGKRTKDYTEAALFINRLRPRITNLGQALQAVSNFKKLTAEGVIMRASKQVSDFEKELIETAPQVLNEANDVVDTVADTMREINEEHVDDVVESVEDILDSVYENYGTDNTESDNFVSEVFDGIEEADADTTIPMEETPQGTKGPKDLTPPTPGKGKGKPKVKPYKGEGSGTGKAMPQNPDEDPLEAILAKKINKYTFAPQKRLTMEAKLLRTLFNIAKENIDPKYPKGNIDPDVFIKSAVMNRELYEDVWDQAQGILQDTYKGDTEAMDILNAYFDQKLVPVYLEKDLTRSIRAKLKEQGINLNQLVRQHYTKVEKVGEDIKNTFRAKGFSEAEMNYLTSYIELEFERLTKEKKEKALQQIFKPKKVLKRLGGTQMKRILELSNLGAYTDDRYKHLIYEQLGLPVLSPEDIEFIDKKMVEYEAETNEDKKKLIYGQIKVRVAEKRVATRRDKIKAIMRIAMLLNGKTIITRNIPGNMVLGAAENVKDIPGALIDTGISKVLGTDRTTAIPGPTILKAQGKGAVKGVVEHDRDRRYKSDTSPGVGQFELPTVSPFKNKGLSKPIRVLDGMVRYFLGIGDRPFFEAATKGQEEMFKKFNKGGELTEAQMQIAKEVGLERTYQNQGTANEMAKSARKLINFGRTPNTIGPGDILMPFTMTLGNMTMKAIEYSGGGLVMGIADLNKLIKMAGGGGGKPPKPPKGKKGSLNAPEPGRRRRTVVSEEEILRQQKKTVDELGRGLVGILLLGAGAVLYGASKISEPLSENKNERGIQMSLGIQGNAYKYKGKYYSLEFLEPIVTAIIMGANLSKWKKDEIGAAEMLSNTINNLFNTSLYTALEDIFAFGNVAENVFKEILAAPEMFVPTLFKQIEQTMDPYQRDTYNKNYGIQVINKIKAKIPVLAETLPAKVDIWGNEILNYDGDNNPLRTMLQPNFTTREKQNAAATLALDVFHNTGNGEVLPKVAPYKFTYTIDGVEGTYRLTAEERIEYQKAVGGECLEEFTKLANSKYFMENKTYKDKEKAMYKIVKAIHDEMRLKILKDNEINVK